MKVAWADTEDEGVDHAHRLWANSGLPGELAQVLPSPQHFEQASQLVTRESTAESIVAGNDVDAARRSSSASYVDAGYDEVYVANMGPHYLADDRGLRPRRPPGSAHMSTTKRLMQATPDQVWAVLADGWLYPLWVVGATRMREVDDHWPAPGARLHHSVGSWPLTLDDITEVVEGTPGARLVLQAHAWPAGRADVTLTLHAQGAETEVVMEEQASAGPGALVPKVIQDPILTWRNVESLRRLAFLAERRSSRCHERAGHDVRRRGHRLRPERAGGREPAGRPRVVRARPRGAAEDRWCRRQRRGRAPGIRARHVQLVLPAGLRPRTIQSLHLEEHGLRWRHAPAVLGHPFADGGWALLHGEREVTARLADAEARRRRRRVARALRRVGCRRRRPDRRTADAVPPVRSALSLLTRLRRVGGLGFVRTLLTPAAELGRRRFGGEGPAVLLAGNAGHADIPLDAPGSGLMGLLMTMLGQTVGFPVPEGGAGRLADALAGRFTGLGGEIRCHAEVIGIDVDSGRTTGVRTATARVRARRAVIADVAAPHLFGRLLDADDVPARVAQGMAQFEMDPGTVKVDWALNGPVPWLTEPAYPPGTVHIADSLGQMQEALGQVWSGAVPAEPFMLTGQMTTSDPTRSPPGTESFWAYTHVPQRTRTDAGTGEIRGVWDSDDCEHFADRMQARIERLAPGFGSQILARRVLGPGSWSPATPT